jgi:hypothetical protein
LTHILINFQLLYLQPNVCHEYIFIWAKMPKVYLLDYVAGNVRSLVNAIEKVGYTVEWIKSPEDVEKADVSRILARKLATDWSYVLLKPCKLLTFC